MLFLALWKECLDALKRKVINRKILLGMHYIYLRFMNKINSTSTILVQIGECKMARFLAFIYPNFLVLYWWLFSESPRKHSPILYCPWYHWPLCRYLDSQSPLQGTFSCGDLSSWMHFLSSQNLKLINAFITKKFLSSFKTVSNMSLLITNIITLSLGYF